METLHPGIFFEEVVADGGNVMVTTPAKPKFGNQPVQNAPTAIAGFIGTALRGKVGKAKLITNWTEFVNEYGGFSPNSYLAYAVKGFFENGGREAYISRVVHYTESGKTSSIASYSLLDGTAQVLASIEAKSDGIWGNDITVDLVHATGNLFTLTVKYKGLPVEEFKELTLAELEVEAEQSKLINVLVTQDGLPAVLANIALTGGADGLTGMTDADYLGTELMENGLQALRRIKVNLLAIPGITSQAVHSGMIDFVDTKGKCMAILDAPMAMNPGQVKTYVTVTANLVSENACIYYPFVTVADPIGLGKSPKKNVPPCGHVMGVMANMDGVSGVWSAPAGTDAKIRGILGTSYAVYDEDQDLLNPVNVNCIRAFDGLGTLVWGTRTLGKGEFLYIPNRRLVNFIEDSLDKGMKWTNFKPNGDKLWEAIKADCEVFLNQNIFAKGGLKGSSPEEAFYVKCDAEINSQATIDAGKTIVDVGLAMHKPNEFTIFRLNFMR